MTKPYGEKSDRYGTLLRYAADRWSVLFVCSVLALRLAVYFSGLTWLGLASVLPLFLISTSIAALNHHHQHLNVFRSALLNRVYELAFALQTGAGPYTWVLHHNLGHHLNYLNQPPHAEPDESHWTRADGSPMGRVEYTLHLFWHHPFDVLRVGRKHPKLYRAYWLMRLPLYLLIGAGLWLDPRMFTLAFLLPASLTMLHTCWATYEHHAGHRATSHFDASVNRENRLFNLFSWNLGYHTAHHYRPGVHWSLLPELHATIRDRIPSVQLLPTFW